MKKYFVAVTMMLSLASFAARASIIKEISFTCPIGGETFSSFSQFSGFQIGSFLDLKPHGMLAAPSPLPVCPSNGLVMYKDKFNRKELARLEEYVLSEEYRDLRKIHTDYYIVAKLKKYLGASQNEIAFTMLQATWEAKPGEQYRQYALETLEIYKSMLQSRYPEVSRRVAVPEIQRVEIPKIQRVETPNENVLWLRHQLVAGELERRLERFEEAEARFAELAKLTEIVKGADRDIVELQMRLIKTRNSRPEKIPEPDNIVAEAKKALRVGNAIKALMLVKPLAENGNPESQLMMGLVLEKGGKNVAINPIAAAQWFRKAAEQNNAIAKFHLSRLLFSGIGVAQNAVEAEKWLAESMQQRYTPAREQYALLKNPKERLFGIGDKHFGGLFLTAQDFSGGVGKSGSELDRSLEYGQDANFAKLEGVRYGVTEWLGKAYEGFYYIGDKRWTFPSALAAKSYMEQSLPMLSENLLPLADVGDFCDQSIAFSGESVGYKELNLYNWIFLVRQGNVLAKLHIMVDLEKKVPGNKDAVAAARRLAKKLKGAE